MQAGPDNFLLNRITSHPDMCHGKPVIRGLRYPVQYVLEWLASGMSYEDILAALSYAARVSQVKRVEIFSA